MLEMLLKCGQFPSRLHSGRLYTLAVWKLVTEIIVIAIVWIYLKNSVGGVGWQVTLRHRQASACYELSCR